MKNRHELPEMLTFDTRSSFEKVLAFSLGDEKSRECVDKLLNRYGSLATAFSETADELCSVCDISMNNALLIKLIAYVNSRRVTEEFEFGKVHTELELREYIGALFLGASIEKVYAILLDEKGRTVSVEHINDGVVNASNIVPRKILECAKKKKSTRVILAHNHPKGTSVPSKDDIVTTGKLQNMLAGVGVSLCAHYIAGDDDVRKIDTDVFYSVSEY